MSTRSAVVRLSADVSGLVAGYQRARLATTDLARAGMEGAAAHRQALDTVARGAGLVGLAAAAGLGLAVKTAADFDAKMSGVQAASGEGAAAMEDLRAAAIQAGADTAFSAGEAADGITNLAKAGISTADILEGGLSGALDLAAAGELGVADAAEDMATALTQFKLTGADASHVADLMAAGANKAQGEVQDLAYALNYAGLPANALGVSIEQTVGTLALFAKNGLLGSQAGSSLRGVLSSLSSPSAAAAKQMKELGIDVFDAHGKFVGLDGVANELQSSMGDLTQEERQNALGKIFSNAQLQAANILYTNGAAGVRKWTNEVNDSGAASRTAATKLDNLRGDLEELGGSFETALIGTGEGSQGMLRGLTQNLTKVVNAYNDMPQAAQSATASLLGVTAVVGGGAWLGATVVNKINTTRAALAELSVSSSTAATAMSAIGKGMMVGAVLIGVKLIDDAMDNLLKTDFKDSDLNRSLTALASGNVSGTIADAWGGDLDGLNDDLDSLDNHLGQVWGTMDKFLPGSLTPVEDARDRFEKLDQALAQMVEGGQKAEAAAIFDRLATEADKGGNSVDQLKDNLDQYQLALDNAGHKGNFFGNTTAVLTGRTTKFAAAASQGAEGIAELGSKAGPSAEKLKALQEALADDRKAASDVAGEFFNLGEKLDDAKVSLADWIRGLEKQAEALRNFRVNAQTAAKRGLNDGLIAALEKAGTTGALRMKQLANATDAEIGRANKAWRAGQREIQKTVDAMVRVPNALATDLVVNGVPQAHRDLDGVQHAMTDVDRARAHPVVDVNGSPAFAAIEGVKTALRNIHDEQVNVYVNRVGGVTSSYGGHSADAAGADGLTVPGPRSPYGDKVLVHLAPGEEVITNRHGEADQFRADRAARRIPAYSRADGGYVPRAPAVMTSSGGGGGWGSGPVQLVVEGQAFTAYLRAVSRTEARDVVTRTATHNNRTRP